MRSARWSLRRNWVGYTGLAVLLAITLSVALAPVLVRHDPLQQNILKRLRPPAWAEKGDPSYLLGTDHLGRDTLSRLLYGGRLSLMIGLVSTCLSGALGTLVGLVAGYREGVIGAIAMRLVDIQTAFPFLIIAIAVVAALGSSPTTLVFTLALWTWVPFARITHGAVLAAKQRDYVQAERALGAREERVLFRHILPNVVAPLIVIWTFAVAQAIIAESSLSFLGLGIRPPAPSWGSMLSDGREYLDTAWWVAVLPILAIVLTVLSVNITGDWLRERFDPKLRR